MHAYMTMSPELCKATCQLDLETVPLADTSVVLMCALQTNSYCKTLELAVRTYLDRLARSSKALQHL